MFLYLPFVSCFVLFCFCFVLFYFVFVLFVFFVPICILTRVKISLDKNHEIFCKAFYIHVSTECFLTFVIDFLFFKILAFFA